MRDEAAALYDRLRTARPELFANTPGGIDILLDPDSVRQARRGTTEDADDRVGVVYADRFVTLLRDAVRFPGGALGLYVRMMSTAASPGAVILPSWRTTASSSSSTTGTPPGPGTGRPPGHGRGRGHGS
ncbi:hypothetical protein ACFQ2B_07940 [Streptomyces stramineus]